MSSEKDWINWGRMDPYFGVLSENKFRSENINFHKEEFFNSGEHHVARQIDIIERRWGRDIAKRTAVDFGCGVGRLVIPLSRYYERVIGIDISPDMLAEAEKNCIEQGVNSADFCAAPSELDQFDRQIDLVNSHIVLQHIKTSVGISLISQLLASLAPGGVASLHVTTSRKLKPVKEFIYIVKHYIPFTKYMLNLVQGKRWNEPLMQMNNYPIYIILDLYRSMGMVDIFCEPTFDSSYGFVIYARKAG
jgi:2-polyprenyl-3-methyl-5-hydroxy-6-metoxy-1,4-benzoquinol methylase